MQPTPSQRSRHLEADASTNQDRGNLPDMSMSTGAKTPTRRPRYSSTVSITPHRIELRASNTDELLTLADFAFTRARDAGYLAPLGKRDPAVVDSVLRNAREVNQAMGKFVHSVMNGVTEVPL